MSGKTYLLAGAALQAAERVREIDHEFARKMEELKAAAEDTARQLRQSNEDERKALWDTICAAHELDPNLPWTLDSEYHEEHGIMILKADQSAGGGATSGMPAGAIPIGADGLKALLAAMADD